MKKQVIIYFVFFLFPVIIAAQHISSGLGNHTLVVRSDGATYAWGYNYFGQLGNGSNTDSNIPSVVDTTGKAIAQVSSGYAHSIALSVDGTTYSCGNNYFGQLGNGSNIESNKFAIVDTTGKKITQVAAGGLHTVVLDSDGKVYTCGNNTSGQLGNGDTLDSSFLVEVHVSGTIMEGKKIIQVAAGAYHNVALALDGSVYSWGKNASGQLGNGDTLDSSFPVAVQMSGTPMEGKTITQIAAGENHTIVLSSDGKVYTWGNNASGQLGNGDTLDSNFPVAVQMSGTPMEGKAIKQVASGSEHCIALDTYGEVYTWGYNEYGQLGNGTWNNSRFPSKIDTLSTRKFHFINKLFSSNITQVGAGGYHSIALASDGSVYTWGANWSGQLGNGNTNDSNVPVSVDQSGIGPLSVKIDFQVPTKFNLSQNYPNPFNPTTVIKYQIPFVGNEYFRSTKTTLKVYNILGSEVATLVNKQQKAGNYEVNFNASNLSSGVYFYKLQSGNFVETKKMVLIK